MTRGGCRRCGGSTDHNGRVRRLLIALPLVALVAGCGWDAPNAGVHAVNTAAPSETVEDAVATSPGSTVAVVTLPPEQSSDRAGAGVDDRPAVFGSLDMPSTVAIVGDSLTVSAIEEIDEAVSRLGVTSVVIDGRESRRMVAGSSDLPSGLSAIAGILDESDPELWVVALGTNDVGAQVGSDRFRDDLGSTLRAIPADDAIVWVDLYIRDMDESTRTANGQIRDALRTRRGAVVDWYSHGAVDGLITGDGVHLTERGQQEFAAAIADGIVLVATS